MLKIDINKYKEIAKEALHAEKLEYPKIDLTFLYEELDVVFSEAALSQTHTVYLEERTFNEIDTNLLEKYWYLLKQEFFKQGVSMYRNDWLREHQLIEFIIMSDSETFSA